MTIRRILTLLLLAAGSMNAFSSEPPKLVITILVDQLRYDYLERFHDQFSEGGFRLLMDNGSFLTDAHYNYMPTITGPGHASFLSGAPPAVHGIISNQWFDHRTGGNVNCVSDPSVKGVGADGADGQRSPRNFTGSTLADEMRLRFHSKVIGVSHKDRGAILPAGKKPAGAYWFHSGSGNFITSTYYRQELPEWVKEFNGRKLPAQFIGQTWKRLLDPSFYQWPDDATGERKLAGEDKVTFDHRVVASEKEGFETIIPTPFGNQLLLEFALAALEGEKLGTSTHPDLLCVSFSSNDYVGHAFGPYSQEVQDITLRLDLQLNEFFKQVDQKIGLENVYIVLTADHGVAPTPEFAAEQGLDGHRVDPVEQMRDLLGKLGKRFGPGQYLQTPRIVDGNLYFNHDALRKMNVPEDDVADFIREWALASGNYQAAYSRRQLLEGLAPGELGRRVVNGYNAERSGDVVLVLKPFVLLSGSDSGTTHGSPYAYDTHIPIFFYGSGFQPGRYSDEFSITDIAATLCAALRMNEPSGSIGKPLVKALADQTQ
ncbi:MAG: alkaline phosphatase family protein [Verrucomicrobiae bacterium]|nr:alkaline phosphatase family protein [Verrucomicrobiae bacterium]